MQTVKEIIEDSLKAKKLFDENLLKSFRELKTSSTNELITHTTSIHDLINSQSSEIQQATDDLDRSLRIALKNQADDKLQNDLALARLDSIHQTVQDTQLLQGAHFKVSTETK